MPCVVSERRDGDFEFMLQNLAVLHNVKFVGLVWHGLEMYKLTSPKSKNGNRTITMPNILSISLKKLNDIQKSKKLANPNNFVFVGERILPQQNILNYLVRCCNESGVKKIRIHDLRHSHVSLLISTGG